MLNKHTTAKLRSAALKYGLDPGDYIAKREQGWTWCRNCRKWVKNKNIHIYCLCDDCNREDKRLQKQRMMAKRRANKTGELAPQGSTKRSHEDVIWALSEGPKSPEEVASRIGSTLISAWNLLESMTEGRMIIRVCGRDERDSRYRLKKK